MSFSQHSTYHNNSDLSSLHYSEGDQSDSYSHNPSSKKYTSRYRATTIVTPQVYRSFFKDFDGVFCDEPEQISPVYNSAVGGGISLVESLERMVGTRGEPVDFSYFQEEDYYYSSSDLSDDDGTETDVSLLATPTDGDYSDLLIDSHSPYDYEQCKSDDEAERGVDEQPPEIENTVLFSNYLRNNNNDHFTMQSLRNNDDDDEKLLAASLESLALEQQIKFMQRQQYAREMATHHDTVLKRMAQEWQAKLDEMLEMEVEQYCNEEAIEE